jgi:hypothetical protein
MGRRKSRSASAGAGTRTEKPGVRVAPLLDRIRWDWLALGMLRIFRME